MTDQKLFKIADGGGQSIVISIVIFLLFNRSLQYSSRFHTILRETFDLSEYEYHSLQRIVGVFEYFGLIAEVVASLAWLATFFDGSELVPCKHSLR